MGKYNVPYGFRKTIDFIQEDTLRLASQKLQGANINQLEFTRAFDNVQENDLVFLDPPYTVAHSNNGFIRYNQKLFSLDDQYALADKLRELNRIGAKFILTNAYHKKIKEIFHDTGNFHKLKRKSLIGGKGAKRECINEYLIRNF
jgi:DNA adenine methylase